MRIARVLVAAVLAIASFVPLCGTAQAAAVPGPLADLQSRLDVMTSRAPGHVGVMVEDLATGLSTSVNATASMPAASTIKIPVMVEVFRRLAAGDFDLNTHVTLRGSDKDWGSGDLCDAAIGSSYSISRLLTLMITVSDNTATNMLIRLVGRSAINATMVNLGLTKTRLAADVRSSGNGIRYALRSSPADMAHLLESMAKDRLIDEWSSRAMIGILTGQRHNGLLPAPLPAGTTIAHKTGTLHDTLNDVGIVYLNSEPYVIAVMTTNLPSLDAGRRFIRGVSRLAYTELSRFASWRDGNGLGDLTAPAVTPEARMWQPAAATAGTNAASNPVEPDPEANPAGLPAPVPTAQP